MQTRTIEKDIFHIRYLYYKFSVSSFPNVADTQASLVKKYESNKQYALKWHIQYNKARFIHNMVVENRHIYRKNFNLFISHVQLLDYFAMYWRNDNIAIVFIYEKRKKHIFLIINCIIVFFFNYFATLK